MLKDPRLWNPSARKLLLKIKRGNSPLRRLKKSKKRSTAGALQSRQKMPTSMRGI